MLTSKTITKGFILAGIMNMSVLIFSKLFTNKTIPEFDPEVMSNFGLIMIMVWGLAYISVAKNYSKVKWLVLIFAIEKCIYGVNWINWILEHTISEVYVEDTLAGLFYTVYGINDWLFFVFFAVVFFKLLQLKKN